jgi:hypothetical protein
MFRGGCVARGRRCFRKSEAASLGINDLAGIELDAGFSIPVHAGVLAKCAKQSVSTSTDVSGGT